MCDNRIITPSNNKQLNENIKQENISPLLQINRLFKVTSYYCYLKYWMSKNNYTDRASILLSCSSLQ